MCDFEIVYTGCPQKAEPAQVISVFMHYEVMEVHQYLNKPDSTFFLFSLSDVR